VDGRFAVLDPLGRGGSSVVYQAEQRSMGRKVALKVLKSDLATDEQARRRFLREIRAVSALTDPHTVSVYDVGTTTDGLLYIAMEQLRGRSLANLMRAEGGRLAPDRAVAIAGQILDSLAEAHGAGIIHGDLKPENVFLLDRGGTDFVKVLDFGIATFLDEAAATTDSRQVVGTIQYMSPEQVMGRPLDIRTDLYSLAVLLFEMVSGRLPFDGPTAVELAVRKTRDPAPSVRVLAPNSRVTAELDTFLVRALSANPDDRPRDVNEFRESMTRALRTSQAEPAPAAPPAQATPSAARQTGPGPATILPFRTCHSTASVRTNAEPIQPESPPPPLVEGPTPPPASMRPLAPIPGDRRLSRRERRVRSVSFVAGERFVNAVMTDVSPTGMFVATPRPSARASTSSWPIRRAPARSAGSTARWSGTLRSPRPLGRSAASASGSTSDRARDCP
jgi:serine/threonine-protein kinase